MEFDAVYELMIHRLREELPSTLCYHSWVHTEQVVKAARKLGLAEGLNESQLGLLLAAALFHDTGFLVTYPNNEPIGAQIAAEILPRFGYSTEQIGSIQEMILATSIPQCPKSHLAQILCDADLAYLGGKRYFEIANLLRSELQGQGRVFNEWYWLNFQLKFLEHHQFFTATATELFEVNKTKVMLALRKDMERYGE